MKNILKLEEAGMFLLGVFLFYTQLHYAGWVFWAFLLAPDIGMLGYAVNTKTGAVTYNLLHHKLLAVALFIIGMHYSIPSVQLAGIIIFSHASIDRALGYGLKYPDSFQHTHLGMIGKQKPAA